MATLEEYLPVTVGIVGTIIASFVIMVIGRHLNVFSKTAEKATIATFNFGAVQEDFKRMEKTQADTKQHIWDKLDSIIDLIEKKDETVRIELRRMSEQNVAIDKKMMLVEFQLQQMQGRMTQLESNGSGYKTQQQRNDHH